MNLRLDLAKLFNQGLCRTLGCLLRFCHLARAWWRRRWFGGASGEQLPRAGLAPLQQCTTHPLHELNHGGGWSCHPNQGGGGK